MQGLLKGLWIILVIFTLSPLFGKWYKTSLVSKGLLQAAWCCLCFSLLFAETGFFATYTPGRLWNNFSSLSLWVLKLSGNFQKYITTEIIKNLKYVSKDLLNFATEKKKTPNPNQGQWTCICPYFSLFIFQTQHWGERLLELVALETTAIRLSETRPTVSQGIATLLRIIVKLI